MPLTPLAARLSGRDTRRALLLLALALPGVARAGDDDVEIEVTADPAPTATPAPAPAPATTAPASNAETDALKARIAELETRLATVEKAQATAPAPGPEKPATEPEKPLLGLKISGYAQAQYFTSQLSSDEIDPEGDPLNQDRFLVRRARLRVDRPFTYGRAAIELDANTVNGPSVGVKRVEIAGSYPAKDADAPPLAELTAGLTEIPFGHELPTSSRTRVFMERTLGSRGFFPSEYDAGARLSGGIGPIRYALSAQNGVPIDGVGNSVSTKEKTFVGRLGFETPKSEAFALDAGVSYLTGTGFHAGTPATKSQLLWSDDNEDGRVTLNELEAVNGQAATASETFERWGVNADLDVAFKTPLGWTRLFGEATMASNLDRGYLPADPISTGYDVREIAWSAGAVQDVTKWALVGFRADSYDPNSDMFESRRGEFVPTDVSVLTLSPVIGAQFGDTGRLLLQYDYVVDFLGRDDLAQPIDLPNDQLTLRAQVAF